MTETPRRDVLAQALREIRELKARQSAAEARRPIAVVGLGCRLPGADDPAALWRLLCDGVDATAEVPPGRWSAPEPPGIYSRRGGWLREVDGFDAAFFGISPREARTLDPQQRLFLEVIWETLEHAAIAPDRLRGSRTGVYCGITQVDYAQLLAAHADPSQLDGHAGTGIAINFAAGRVARTLDLRGPALAVDAACAASLVAVHLAVEALRRGAIDLALAGGVNLILHPAGHAVLCQARALSRAGRCQTFDAAADGYVRAEGCGVVALARLDDARRAGHRILAVIRGTAVNHDGASAGLTVPSGEAQTRVIAAACEDAGVDPRSVAYVEAHGTGTALGDPIELRALAEALGRERTSPLLVGALKTNLGHLESAAGVAGLIKAVLALHLGELPPQLGPQRPNPALDWSRLPIEVVRARRPWPEGPRIAGVSAFGASGTNAHVILAAADPGDADPGDADPGDAEPGDAPELIVLSAATPAALVALAARHAAHPDAGPLASICHTASVGRAALPYATAVVASSVAALAAQLAAFAREAPARASLRRRPDTPVPVAFIVAGQGPRPELPPDLLTRPGPLRAALERCDALLRPHRPGSLLDLLAPHSGPSPLDETGWAQPALFALEWALAEQWRAWGVTPRWVLGHSLGAFVAACVAGVLDLESALQLVVRRADLMQRTAIGAMAAVFADEARVRATLSALIAGPVIAAVNGPRETVLAGEPAAIDAALLAFAADGVHSRRLAVTRGFHSPLMDPILDEFAAAVAALRLQPPDRVFISDTTGRPATDAWTQPATWRRHLREPVRFADALAALRDDGCTLCVELGPGAVLSARGRRADEPLRWVPSLARDRARPSDPDARHRDPDAGHARPSDPDAVRRDPDAGHALPTAPDAVRRDPDAGHALPTAPDARRRDPDAGHALPSDPDAVRGDPDAGRRALLTALGQLAVCGARVDLAAASRGRRRVALPTYPFERRRAWIGPGGRSGREAAAAAPPLLGRRLAAAAGEALHEAEWRADGPAVLRDHTVFGRCVVSGAVACSVALAAARALDGDRRFALEGIEFRAPLILPAQGGLTVRTRLTRRDDHLEFTVESQDGARVRVHVTGRISPTGDPPPPARELAAIRERCPEQLAGDDFYQRFWRAEQHGLGPSYRTIDRIWRRDGEALARLRPPPGAPEGPEGELWAAICFAEATGQLLLPAVPDHETVFLARGDTFLGSGMTRSVQHGPSLAPAAWIHARLDAADADGFVGEVVILDEHGRVLVAMEGLGVRRIDPEQLRRASERTAAADARHVLEAPVTDRPRRLRAWLTDTVAALVGGDDGPLDRDLPLARLGFDSLMTVDLLERLDDALGVRLPPDALREQTLAGLAEQVQRALAVPAVPAATAVLAVPAATLTVPAAVLAVGTVRVAAGAAAAPPPPYKPAPEGCWRLIGATPRALSTRLFCLPHAGASAMAFQPWRAHIPAGVEVHAAQLPGRWSEPGEPLTDLDAVVAGLVAELRPLLTHGPWALFGASLGGLLAFEVARALRRIGAPSPTHVIVAGAATPDQPHPLVADTSALRHALHGDGDPQLLVRLGLVPEAQRSADMLPLIVPALRADLELVLRHQHRPEAALACPIVALLGTHDGVVGRHQVTGWVAHTAADFALRRVAGGHLFYREAPAETWQVLAPLLAR